MSLSSCNIKWTLTGYHHKYVQLYVPPLPTKKKLKMSQLSYQWVVRCMFTYQFKSRVIVIWKSNQGIGSQFTPLIQGEVSLKRTKTWKLVHNLYIHVCRRVASLNTCFTLKSSQNKTECIFIVNEHKHLTYAYYWEHNYLKLIISGIGTICGDTFSNFLKIFTLNAQVRNIHVQGMQNFFLRFFFQKYKNVKHVIQFNSSVTT